MDVQRLIMVMVFWAAAACIPMVLGMGLWRILYGKKYRLCCTIGDSYITGLCVVIGITEVVFLGTMLTGRSIRFMALGLLGMIAAVLLLLTVIAGLFLVRSGWKRRQGKAVSSEWRQSFGCKNAALAAVLALLVLGQIIVLMTGDVVYRQGDMTLEMVQSFLAAGTPYEVNPLTGQAYTAGIPMRLKILCLPGLYASICSMLGLDAGLVVCRLIPVVVLFASYVAYAGLGRTLFGDNVKARLLFLVSVSLLYWMGDYFASNDAFLLLHSGFRGVSVRNAVLLPFVWNMCLGKKYRTVLLAVLAEACIVWTLYGMGMCLLSAVIMISLSVIRKFWTKKNARQQMKD